MCSNRCRELSGSRRDPLRGLMDRIKCSNRCRELSGSLREPLRVLMDDVIELSGTIDVESYRSRNL